MTVVVRQRPPIPDPEPIDEARQLVGWLRDEGVDRDVVDRLEQVIDGLVVDIGELAEENDTLIEEKERLDDRVGWLEDKIAAARSGLEDIVGDLGDDHDGKDYYADDGSRVEGERQPAGPYSRHPTINVRSPWGRMIPIDEELAPIISGLWRRGIKTCGCCQETTPGKAFISFDDSEAETAVQSLVPAAASWNWIKTGWGRIVDIPRSELRAMAELLDGGDSPAA
jgi:hypothetical protein